MHKVSLSPEALEDLDNIWLYIAQDNPSAADKVIEAAYRVCQHLAEHPELGVMRHFSEGSLANMRSLVISDFPKYLIFYRTTPTAVEVVRVLHGARDIEKLF